MHKLMPLSLLFAFVLTFGIAYNAYCADDNIFRAMEDELGRSLTELKIEDMATPYFLSYLIRDDHTISISSRYGGG